MRPTLTDLRPASGLENYADVVMFLHRDDYYNTETDLKGIAEVIVAKNLWGRTGKCELGYIPDLGQVGYGVAIFTKKHCCDIFLLYFQS